MARVRCRGCVGFPWASARYICCASVRVPGSVCWRIGGLLSDPVNELLCRVHGGLPGEHRLLRVLRPQKARGMMVKLIESFAVPGSAPGCPELTVLGRTLKTRVRHPDLLRLDERVERPHRSHQRQGRNHQKNSPQILQP